MPVGKLSQNPASLAPKNKPSSKSQLKFIYDQLISIILVVLSFKKVSHTGITCLMYLRRGFLYCLSYAFVRWKKQLSRCRVRDN